MADVPEVPEVLDPRDEQERTNRALWLALFRALIVANRPQLGEEAINYNLHMLDDLTADQLFARLLLELARVFARRTAPLRPD